MVDMLSHLNHSAPGVRSELLFTVIALGVGFNELSNEGLLYLSLVVQFFFNCDF